MRNLTLFALLLVATSCAKIPIGSVELAHSIAEEGRRMHHLNIVLLNNMFKAKREKIDLFIRQEFTPEHLEQFMKRVPEDTDFKAELPDMLSSIVPEINGVRNDMQSTLEAQRVKLITKLNEDYAVFDAAMTSLTELLASASRVDEERRKLLIHINQLSNGKVDLNQVENLLDDFILKTGDLGERISDLNENIDSIIGN